MHAGFKMAIHREDEYLQQRFDPAHLDYRTRVKELIIRPTELAISGGGSTAPQ